VVSSSYSTYLVLVISFFIRLWLSIGSEAGFVERSGHLFRGVQRMGLTEMDRMRMKASAFSSYNIQEHMKGSQKRFKYQSSHHLIELRAPASRLWGTICNRS